MILKQQVEEFIRSAELALTTEITKQGFEAFFDYELNDNESEVFKMILKGVLEELYPDEKIPGR